MTSPSSNEVFLNDLMTHYGTDKNIWGYHPYYTKVMGEHRLAVKRVLEIGICGFRDIPNNVVGASLFVWRDYFPNAEVYGVDIDGRFIFNDQHRIHTAQCDAYDADALHAALVAFGGLPFDMIVDDAVHDPGPQIKLMNQLGEWMAPGGHYFMEDTGPYKMPNGIEKDMFDHIRGYSGIVACSTPKPEVLVIGVK
jgi:hypothetical protein